MDAHIGRGYGWRPFRCKRLRANKQTTPPQRFERSKHGIAKLCKRNGKFSHNTLTRRSQRKSSLKRCHRFHARLRQDIPIFKR